MNFLIYHNLLRWAVLLFGLWTVFNAIGGFFSKREFSRQDNVSTLLFMISCDIQLLLGLLLYFSKGTKDWFGMLKSDMGAVMKNAGDRFFTVEHIFMMLTAWVLVHVGRSAIKRTANDHIKHKRMLIYFGIALLLILAAIPWPFRADIGRPLFQF